MEPKSKLSSRNSSTIIRTKRRNRINHRSSDAIRTPLSILPEELLREIFSFSPYARFYRTLSLLSRHFYHAICLSSPQCKKLLYQNLVRKHQLFGPLCRDAASSSSPMIEWELLWKWHKVQNVALIDQKPTEEDRDVLNLLAPHLESQEHLKQLQRPIERRLAVTPPERHATIVYQLVEGMLISFEHDVYQILRIESAAEDANNRKYHNDTRFKLSLRQFELPYKESLKREVYMRGYDTVLTVTVNPWKRKMYKVYCVDQGKIYCKGIEKPIPLPRGEFGKCLSECEEHINLFTSPKKKIAMILIVYQRDISCDEMQVVGFCCKYLVSNKGGKKMLKKG